MERAKKRLVVVSNRLPFKLVEKGGEVNLQTSSGGLVSALKSYYESEDSEYPEKLWVGSADFPAKRWGKYAAQENQVESFQVEPIFIETRLYNRYYNGFCNATLWPLFHYFSTYTFFEKELYKAYEEVNRIFADKLLEILEPGDVLWIHDYQLLLLPQMIRDKIPDATIGFFLHIPFPSYEIFRLMHRPWKEGIINGMLGADIVGFHTHEYVQHFLKAMRMVTGYDHQYRSIIIGDRIVKADLFPLGIDYPKFEDAAKDPETIRHRKSILQNFQGKKIIFSVDRLDYTKGLTNRLDGFEQFIERYPEWRGKVVFILAMVPSRQIISKYNERKNLIEERVGRINGKYSTLKWQPVIYRYHSIPFPELCALYQSADVGLITPLRDGMNLVAKEYVASSIDGEGVLILSEMAGAASELNEALLINPMDQEEMANMINKALTMPKEEQKHKTNLMKRRLKEYDVKNWVKDFLTQLREIKKIQVIRESKFITPSIESRIVESFKSASSRHLFLDYDGTLVPFAKHPREASPGNDLLNLLEGLTQDKKNNITIISGRDSNVLEEWFSKLPINLVAEHGASFRRVGKGWAHEKSLDQTWKPIIRPSFELFLERCPGSFIEEKNHTLAWHYRNVANELGFVRSRELLDNLLHLVRNSQLSVIDGNKVIEVRVAGVDKGVAARKLVSEIPSDFVMVIGDDKTDEDMFGALESIATTIKVGSGITKARYILPSQSQVIELLTKL